MQYFSIEPNNRNADFNFQVIQHSSRMDVLEDNNFWDFGTFSSSKPKPLLSGLILQHLRISEGKRKTTKKLVVKHGCFQVVSQELFKPTENVPDDLLLKETVKPTAS